MVKKNAHRIKCFRIILSAILLLTTVVFVGCSISKRQDYERRGLTEDEKDVLKRARFVRLVVETSTWRQGKKPYDIENAARRRLETVGFRVIPEANEGYDATLRIDYKETKGGNYKHTNTGKIVCCGTTIRCFVSCLIVGWA
jgi:hypothetical protein